MPRSIPTQWRFRSRLRRSAWGWRGTKPAIVAIDEALSEIIAVNRHDPVLAAEGAIIFLEKISPAVRGVDSSSGALGGATYSAIHVLVPIIAAAPVSEPVRAKWLNRLFEAIQEDDPPYIESLGDFWGELCVTPMLASWWADELIPGVLNAIDSRKPRVFTFFSGAGICYAALFKAGRHDELLTLLASESTQIWPYLIWGGRVHAARGEVDHAIAYMKDHGGINTPVGALASFAEGVLLQAGRRAEAYAHHAIDANQGNSRLSTYRNIAKKYPDVQPDRILADLMASTPGDEGKWFATAKTLKRLDLAMELAWRSPCDPKTLVRAARDHLRSHPAFATESALAALHWMSRGHGYELTALDVRDAYRYAQEAAQLIGQSERVQIRMTSIFAGQDPTGRWMRQALGFIDS